jgi:hypothetical protein
MVGLQFPDTRTNVLIAAAIAHQNGGYFRQNDPPGWITVEVEGRLVVEREWIKWALGRSYSDQQWHSLAVKPQGRLVVHDDATIVVEQDDGEGGRR